MALSWSVLADFGAGLVDISGDVKKRSITAQRGLAGDKPTDRIANIGRMTFELRNDAGNSGGKLGYYTPGHADCRSGWNLGVHVQLKLNDGTTNAVRWDGYVSSITPAQGVYLSRNVMVVAEDWFGRAAAHTVNKTVTTQIAKRTDEIIDTLVSDMAIAPTGTSYATDPDTLNISLDDIKENTKTYQALQRAAQTSVGYLFCTGAGTLTYQSRHTRLLTTTVSGTLDGNMSNLQMARQNENLYNDIDVTVYPQRIDGTAVTLAQLDMEISIPAGGSVTFSLSLRDPDSTNTSVTLYAGSEVAPVANTDYKMSSIYGNGGNDLNGSCTIAPTWGANNVTTVASNSAAVVGYLNRCALRGIGIYKDRPITINQNDATSIAAYEQRKINYQMPYQNNTNVASDAGIHWLTIYKDPRNQVKSVSFIGNISTALSGYAVNLEIGQLIKLVESVTATNSNYFINGISYRIQDDLVEVTLILESIPTYTYWKLGTSELGTSTRLAF
jgi:hypothetical protein